MPKKKKEMAEEIIIDAFKEGNYPQGKFGAKELSEIQSTYDPNNYEAPILIGHLSDPSYKGKSSIPAFGWIGKIKVVGDHLKLVASQFSEQLKEFIKNGLYKKVSAAFFQPDDPSNPTPGKWHLHHLAFLGGTPPAVKGLEQIAFSQMRGLGVEFQEMDVEVTEDGDLLEQIEELGAKDTIKNITEICASFISKVEDALNMSTHDETCKSRIQLAASDMSGEIYHCINTHFTFLDKLEKIEETEEAQEEIEMSEKKNWLIQLAEKIAHKRKDKDMDAKEKKEYQDKIDVLTLRVKEFQDQEEAEKKEAEEKAKLDAEVEAKVKVAAEAEAKEKEEKDQADGIKEFCEKAIKGNRMTPAMRETDEKIMLDLAKVSSEALKSFQQKYGMPVVPLGITKEIDIIDPNDTRPQVIVHAEKYVKAHAKEFSDLKSDQALSRALYLHSIGRIKFEDDKP